MSDIRPAVKASTACRVEKVNTGMEDACVFLSNELDVMRSVIDHLQSKLGPVLRPAMEGVSEDRPEPPLGSQLRNNINDNAFGLGAITQELRELIDRLDI